MYSLTVRRFERLDDHTVLTFGRGRYALEGGGFAEGRLYWLDDFRDGLIYRALVFMQRPEQDAPTRNARRRTRTPPPDAREALPGNQPAAVACWAGAAFGR